MRDKSMGCGVRIFVKGGTHSGSCLALCTVMLFIWLSGCGGQSGAEGV
jgi:hypothetical protein